jgi:hypothetical protein
VTAGGPPKHIVAIAEVDRSKIWSRDRKEKGPVLCPGWTVVIG